MTDREWFAHPSASIDDPQPDIGSGTRIWHATHVRSGAHIGPDCNIGQNVYIGADVRIGRGCKIQNNVNVYEGVTLEDFVFCGPSMTFTNLSSPLPRAEIDRRHMLQSTIVRRGASIGAGAVIVCGHEIGTYAFVAAGAVVTRDVAPYELVAGNPARRIGWTCACGGRLRLEHAAARCTAPLEGGPAGAVCGRSYVLEADRLRPTDPG